MEYYERFASQSGIWPPSQLPAALAQNRAGTLRANTPHRVAHICPGDHAAIDDFLKYATDQLSVNLAAASAPKCRSSQARRLRCGQCGAKDELVSLRPLARRKPTLLDMCLHHFGPTYPDVSLTPNRESLHV